MQSVVLDVRYALRMLIRNPGFTLISVLALGLGIGANTAIFSVVNSVLLRPLPFKDPERLAMIWEKNIPRSRDRNVVSPANYLDWRDQNQSFEQIGAYLFTLQPLNLATSGGEPERVMGALVTAEVFPLLGIQPFMGRTFGSVRRHPETRNPDTEASGSASRIGNRRGAIQSSVWSPASCVPTRRALGPAP